MISELEKSAICTNCVSQCEALCCQVIYAPKLADVFNDIVIDSLKKWIAQLRNPAHGWTIKGRIGFLFRCSKNLKKALHDCAIVAIFWRKINRAEETRLLAAVPGSVAPGEKWSSGKEIYSCRALRSDGKCGIYKFRPPVCSGYPYYSKQTLSGDSMLTTLCGYDRIVKEDSKALSAEHTEKV